jgi:hypothetical protein
MVIQEAEKLPMNDALNLLRRKYKVYRDLGKGMPAYSIAANELLRAEADIVIKNATTLHYLQIDETLKWWEDYYIKVSMNIPDYQIVVNELIIARDVWQSLIETKG